MNHHKKAIVLFSVLLWAFCGYGQKSDYIWLTSHDDTYPNTLYDSVWNIYYGTDIINFNYSPCQVYLDSLQMFFEATNVSFCDSDGNLLFYSNGIYIANYLNEMIANSDSLNADSFDLVYNPTFQSRGYKIPQGMLAFQNVVNPEQFYLIHSRWNYDSQFNVITDNTMVTLLDMSANAGLGNVIYKNQSIINGVLGYELSATRHANGRDWWVLVQKRNTNCYYRILLDNTGPHLLSDTTCQGEEISFTDAGTSAFSTDGSKYANFFVASGIRIFDFDRCSGELSNPIFIPTDVYTDSGWLACGIAFSPNNRFLYVSMTQLLLQFDLSASDVPTSVDTIARYDGFQRPFASYFGTAQPGPDGKIYFSCGNGEADYHVINNPNAKGDSCDFVQHQLILPATSDGVPNFPNYRLGPLPGGPCDTLYTNVDEASIEKREQILKVFPNPATDIVTVDYGFTNWSAPGVVSLVIVNELGQPVYSQPVPQYSGYQRIDVGRYASGVYTAYIKRDGMVVSEQKFAKE